jgi:hypothetical protein
MRSCTGCTPVRGQTEFHPTLGSITARLEVLSADVLRERDHTQLANPLGFESVKAAGADIVGSQYPSLQSCT